MAIDTNLIEGPRCRMGGECLLLASAVPFQNEAACHIYVSIPKIPKVLVVGVMDQNMYQFVLDITRVSKTHCSGSFSQADRSLFCRP